MIFEPYGHLANKERDLVLTIWPLTQYERCDHFWIIWPLNQERKLFFEPCGYLPKKKKWSCLCLIPMAIKSIRKWSFLNPITIKTKKWVFVSFVTIKTDTEMIIFEPYGHYTKNGKWSCSSLLAIKNYGK